MHVSFIYSQNNSFAHRYSDCLTIAQHTSSTGPHHLRPVGIRPDGPVALLSGCACLLATAAARLLSRGTALYICALPQRELFFLPYVLKRHEKSDRGAMTDAETPTSRREYIYTSATQHPRSTDSKKKICFSNVPCRRPGVSQGATISGRAFLNF